MLTRFLCPNYLSANCCCLLHIATGVEVCDATAAACAYCSRVHSCLAF